MVEEGLHLDVAGGGEILTAVKAGADPARLVLHGNAKTDEELELAVEHGLGLVVIDNFDDIDRLERIVPQGRRQRCLVRVIPGVEAATHASQATGHAGSKFGLMPDDARDAIARVERSSVLQLDGVHTHVGSQLLNVEQLAAAVEPIAKLGTFETYDLGGGLGVRYTYDEHPPTVDDYAEAMVDAGPRAAARRQPHHRRAGPQHGRDQRLHGVPRHDGQARSASPTSRSTAVWATTSKCR